jgi:hypothetical protein
MSTSYFGSSTFHPSITIPAGGDARTAASVNGPLKDLQDNATYLRGILTDGVSKLKTVNSLTELKALTVGISSYQIAFNANILEGRAFGLWLWIPTFSTPIIEGFAEASTTGTPGRWYNLIGSLMVMGGSDDSPRLSLSTLAVPNRVEAIAQISESSPSYREIVTPTVFTDFGFNTDPMPLKAGDRVKITCSLTHKQTNNESSALQVAVYDGTTTTGIAASEAIVSIPGGGEGFTIPVTVTAYHSPVVDGMYTYKLQGIGTSTTNLRAYAPRQFIIEVIRP